MNSKVSVGDYISYSLRNPSETTSNNVVTSVSMAVKDANQSQTHLTTIATATESFVVYEAAIVLSYKNNQGKSVWVVEQ